MEAHTVRGPAPHRPPKLGGTVGRLTVLLDGTPHNRRAHSLSRANASSLVGQLQWFLDRTPYSSVRLVAFNLDEAREVFRQEQFDPYRSSFQRLREALNQNVAKVPASVLAKRPAWPEMLAGLVNQELTASEPSDTVVFFGDATRYRQRVPEGLLNTPRRELPLFFYYEILKIYPSKYPGYVESDSSRDTINHLTRSLGGTVFKVNSYYGSPYDRVKAIEGMIERVKQSQNVLGMQVPDSQKN